MRSLKPISDENNATLISSDVKAELDSKISALQNTQNNLESEVADLSNEVSKPNISKENITASKITSDRIVSDNSYSKESYGESLTFDNITATESVNTHLLRADEISADDASIHHIDTDDLSVSGTVETNNVIATQIVTEDIGATRVASQELESTSGSIRNLQTDNLEALSLGSPNSLDVAELNTLVSNEETANIETANIKLSEEEKARVLYLYNQMKAFCDDETDAKQFVKVGEPNSGSNETDEYRIIRIPRITSGWYRIELKEQQNNDEENHDGNTLFSLNYYQTETTPIIQYSKKNISDLTNLYYDSTTDYLYVKTYASGYLYWASDAKDFFGAPVIYSELPIDASAKETYVFNTARSHQWVMMGNHTGEYGLTVQGVIEGDIVKDWNEITDINFYGNDVTSLYRTCRAYFKRTFNDEDIYGHSAEVYGYVYHTQGKVGTFGFPYTVKFTHDLDETVEITSTRSRSIDEDYEKIPAFKITLGKMFELWPFVPDSKREIEGLGECEIQVMYGRSSGLRVVNGEDGLAYDYEGLFRQVSTGDYYAPCFKGDGTPPKNIKITDDNLYYFDHFTYFDIPDQEVEVAGPNENVPLGYVTITLNKDGQVNYYRVNGSGYFPSELDLKHFETTPTDERHYEYRDHWNTEVEALEKVCMTDADTIVLTVDSKYGQDDITIDLSDEETEWVSHEEHIQEIGNNAKEWETSTDPDTNDTVYTWKVGIDPYMYYNNEGEYVAIRELRKKTNGSWTIDDEFDVPPNNILEYYTLETPGFETLPFVLGFSFRTMNSDYMLNLENFQGDSSVFNKENE